jgi:hypothetical protein
MLNNPADHDAAIRELAGAVDILSSRFAAIAAYVAAACPTLADRDVVAVKGAAQKAAPKVLIANPPANPQLIATQTVDQIVALARALQSALSARTGQS